MSTLATVLEAKQQMQVLFPRLGIGISGAKNAHYLVVRVRSEADAKAIPADINGVRIEVKTMSHLEKKT